MTTTELLAYWITEREEMRDRKEDRMDKTQTWKFGYSDDPAMGTVRYCNVRREDDKVTRWLAKNWRPNHHSAWELVLARMVNYIPTLERLLDTFDLPEQRTLPVAARIMKEIRSEGQKIWTSAYTISTCGQTMDKVDYVMGVVGAVKAREDYAGETLASWHKWLTQVDGLGSFLAGQVVADMKNTAGHPLFAASDWSVWSTHGPGSLKGLSVFFGKTITPRMYESHIEECFDRVLPLLPKNLHDLHMQDFQNCLCEFSKFMRVRGGGHARNRYTPG